jgi:hypothetical protein
MVNTSFCSEEDAERAAQTMQQIASYSNVELVKPVLVSFGWPIRLDGRLLPVSELTIEQLRQLLDQAVFYIAGLEHSGG